MPESKNTRKMLCPECDTEVSITRDDDGDDVGTCPGCKLNLGEIVTRRRYRSAERKLDEQEQDEKKKTEKKKKHGFFD